jgi:hypothetical protein
MFENLIASLIKRYIARYIDINADQLSAELLYKQQIIIENLLLNAETINEYFCKKFQLPIAIHSIRIGKMQCSLIWSSLFFRSTSSAVIITIENVDIVVHPRKIDEKNFFDDINEKNELQKKENQLNFIEQQLEEELKYFGQVKSTRFLSTIFEKLHIEIVNLHFKYENVISIDLHYTIELNVEKIEIVNESSSMNSLNREIFRIVNPSVSIDMKNSFERSYLLYPSTTIEIHLLHNHFLVN